MKALGEMLAEQDRHADARKVLELLTQNKKGTVRARAEYQLARSFFATGEFEASLKQLEAAQAADAATTEPAEVQRFLAKINDHLGRLEQAAAAYRRAMNSDPDLWRDPREFIRFKSAHRVANQPAGPETNDDAKETLDLVRRYTLLAGKEALSLVQAAEFHFQLGRMEDAFELAGRSRDLAFSSRSQRLLGLIHLHAAANSAWRCCIWSEPKRTSKPYCEE